MEYVIPENAKILSVDPEHYEKIDWSTMTGLCIETDKGNIKLLISDCQSCCESWDELFLETPDNIEKFIGATVLKVEDVCVGLSADQNGYGFGNGDESQIKVTTTKGVLQFAVYNSHNGYYSHASFKQVFDEIEQEYL